MTGSVHCPVCFAVELFCRKIVNVTKSTARRNCNLEKANLTGVDLSEINFSEVIFNNIKINNEYLTRDQFEVYRNIQNEI